MFRVRYGWYVGCSECRMVGMWNFEEVDCLGCEMFVMFGMFRMWDVWNVNVQEMGCLECGMFRRGKIRDV